MGHFKDLKAWQHARRLAILSKPAIERLPDSERGGLADEWRRAAYSVALNIAEGAAKGSREFRRYLDTARASLHEVEAVLDLVVGLGYLHADDVCRDRSRARRMRADRVRPVAETRQHSKADLKLSSVNRRELVVLELVLAPCHTVFLNLILPTRRPSISITSNIPPLTGRVSPTRGSRPSIPNTRPPIVV